MTTMTSATAPAGRAPTLEHSASSRAMLSRWGSQEGDYRSAMAIRRAEIEAAAAAVAPPPAVEVPKEEEEGMAELMAKAAEAEAEVEEERFASLLLQHASRQSEDSRKEKRE